MYVSSCSDMSTQLNWSLPAKVHISTGDTPEPPATIKSSFTHSARIALVVLKYRKMSENLQSAPCSTGQRHSRRHFETCQYSIFDFVRHIHRSQCKLAIQEYRPCHNSSHPVRRTDNHWLLSRRPIQSYITLPWSCSANTSRLPRIHLKLKFKA